MSVAKTSTAMYWLDAAFRVLFATFTRGQTEQSTRYVQRLLWNVAVAFLGELYANITIFKYFNASFIVLFHVFLFLGNCPSWAVTGISTSVSLEG
jgi:hypothetical protein